MEIVLIWRSNIKNQKKKKTFAATRNNAYTEWMLDKWDRDTNQDQIMYKPIFLHTINTYQ